MRRTKDNLSIQYLDGDFIIKDSDGNIAEYDNSLGVFEESEANQWRKETMVKATIGKTSILLERPKGAVMYLYERITDRDEALLRLQEKEEVETVWMKSDEFNRYSSQVLVEVGFPMICGQLDINVKEVF